MRDGPFRRFFQLPAWRAGQEVGVGDAALLERFTRERDEAAFELLLRRHGPMVLSTCQRLLGHAHDAEDAFQATFLVLARRAGSVARREAVAAWLYRVACRVALRLRAARARRARYEQEAPSPEAAVEAPASDLAELRRALDEEVARLPTRHRAAFVLCCLDGMTGAEAARELGCPLGTVSSRLTRARERLRARLARRGLAPAVAAALAALPAPATAIPSIRSTLAAATKFAGGPPSAGAVPSRPESLARGVLRSMAITKLKIAAVVLAVAAVACAGWLSRELEAAPPATKGPPAVAAPKAVAVSVVQPKKGGIDRVSEQTCSIESFQQAEIGAGATGFLKTVAVDIGSRVKKGEVLAVIDAPELELNLRLARVGVEQALGLVGVAEAQLQAAKVEVDAAKKTTSMREVEAKAAQAYARFREKQFDRIKRLYKDGAAESTLVEENEGQLLAARSKADAAVAAVDSARADADVRQVKVIQADAAVKSAQAGVEAAKIGLEKADLAVARTKMAAPFDGVVTRRHHLAGDHVFASDASARQPLFSLQRMDLLRVVVPVPDRVVRFVEPGTPAEVMIDALPDTPFAGTVARVAFAEDPQTRTMRTEIDLANPELRLRPGMTGAVRLRLRPGDPKALRLPQRAVVGRPTSAGPATFVYLVREGKAHLTPVRLGTFGGQEVEVLTGVGPDDRIVADAQGLKEETVPVEVRDELPKE